MGCDGKTPPGVASKAFKKSSNRITFPTASIRRLRKESLPRAATMSAVGAGRAPVIRLPVAPARPSVGAKLFHIIYGPAGGRGTGVRQLTLATPSDAGEPPSTGAVGPGWCPWL